MKKKILIVFFLVAILMTVPFTSVVGSEKLPAKRDNIDLIERNEIFGVLYKLINLIMLLHRNNPEVVSRCQEILTSLTSLLKDPDSLFCVLLVYITEYTMLLAEDLYESGYKRLANLSFITSLICLILLYEYCYDFPPPRLWADNIATLTQLIHPSKVNRCPCE